MITVDTDSTLKILHGLRKGLDNKVQWYRVTSWTLFGALLIDYAIFKVTGVDFFQLISFGIIFIWIMFSIFSMILINKEKQNIDEFFLETEMIPRYQRKIKCK